MSRLTELAEKRTTWCVVAIVALAILVFVPALTCDFPVDDEFVAKAHGAGGEPRPMVAELQPVSEYFRSHWWRDEYDASDLYRPVTKYTIALVYHVAGQHVSSEAMPQHLLNLLLHGWATLLVFLLLRRVAAPLPSLAAALVFGVHAIHIEAVVQIVGRCDLLAFCFGAQGLVLITGGSQARPLARVWRYVVAGALAFLAFCSKEIAVGWVPFYPAFVLGARLLRDEAPAPTGRAALSFLVTLPALALFLWLRAGVLEDLDNIPEVTYAANPLAGIDTFDRIATAAVIQGFALWKSLLPVGLASDHGPAVFAASRSVTDPWFLVCGVGLAALVLLALRRAAREPLLFLAVASFFGLSFVISNIPFPIGTIFAERLYYMPSLGVAFVVAWLVSRWPTSLVGLLLAGWCVYSGGYAFLRSFAFENTMVLAENDVTVRPDSSRLHRIASESRKRKGDLTGARDHLKEAVRLDPRSAASWANYGVALAALGENTEAEAALLTALAEMPGSAEPEVKAEVHATLGIVLSRRGRRPEGVLELERATSLDPTNLRHRASFLDLLVKERQLDIATRVVTEGERLHPGEVIWVFHRARIAMRQRRLQEAERLLRDVVRREPERYDAHIELATTLAARRDFKGAAEICKRLQSDPRVPPNVKETAGGILARLRR